jgi:lactobin A/cerein 7B family class IIb bacteriocin
METRELSMDELEAVSGGVSVLSALASSLCATAGAVAGAVGANGAAYKLYMAAEALLH